MVTIGQEIEQKHSKQWQDMKVIEKKLRDRRDSTRSERVWWESESNENERK